MKALGLVVSDKKIFLHFENLIIDSVTYLCKQFEPFKVGGHQGIIPAEFGQIPVSGSREDVVFLI